MLHQNLFSVFSNAILHLTGLDVQRRLLLAHCTVTCDQLNAVSEVQICICLTYCLFWSSLSTAALFNGSGRMSTAYPSPTGFAGEGEHFRDGSLLKRKQEQWAREKG